MKGTLLLFPLALLVSLALCAIYGRCAAAAGWLAQPETRSSHRQPTVSGAGVAVIATLLLVFAASGPPLTQPALTLLACAAFLSLLGLCDDLLHLSVGLRLSLYAVAAVSTVGVLMEPAAGGTNWLLAGVAAAGILAFSNLFNFMDGIDGLAALQAVCAASVLALSAWVWQADSWYIALCWSLAGGFTGFLFFNRPVARLFMGDAGSIPTGYLLGSLVVAGWYLEGIPAFIGLILVALFVSDAVTTLLFRASRRESLTQAHRQHLYQRLALRWQSHSRVDAVFLLVQWLWLTPLALIATLHPALGAHLCVVAYVPLLGTMVILRRMQ